MNMKIKPFAALGVLAALGMLYSVAPAAAQPGSLEIVGTGDGIDVLQLIGPALHAAQFHPSGGSKSEQQDAYRKKSAETACRCQHADMFITSALNGNVCGMLASSSCRVLACAMPWAAHYPDVACAG